MLGEVAALRDAADQMLFEAAVYPPPNPNTPPPNARVGCEAGCGRGQVEFAPMRLGIFKDWLNKVGQVFTRRGIDEELLEELEETPNHRRCECETPRRDAGDAARRGEGATGCVRRTMCAPACASCSRAGWATRALTVSRPRRRSTCSWASTARARRPASPKRRTCCSVRASACCWRRATPSAPPQSTSCKSGQTGSAATL
jgi:hypothetical protein